MMFKAIRRLKASENGSDVAASSEAGRAGAEDVQTTPDRGPWRLLKSRMSTSIYVASDDFTHDVTLLITGDFASYSDKERYAKWLADTLNAAVAAAGAIPGH